MPILLYIAYRVIFEEMGKMKSKNSNVLLLELESKTQIYTYRKRSYTVFSEILEDMVEKFLNHDQLYLLVSIKVLKAVMSNFKRRGVHSPVLDKSTYRYM